MSGLILILIILLIVSPHRLYVCSNTKCPMIIVSSINSLSEPIHFFPISTLLPPCQENRILRSDSINATQHAKINLNRHVLAIFARVIIDQQNITYLQSHKLFVCGKQIILVLSGFSSTPPQLLCRISTRQRAINQRMKIQQTERSLNSGDQQGNPHFRHLLQLSGMTFCGEFIYSQGKGELLPEAVSTQISNTTTNVAISFTFKTIIGLECPPSLSTVLL